MEDDQPGGLFRYRDLDPRLEGFHGCTEYLHYIVT